MIGFVGLSHLGIVSSIATASKGFDVLAYHPDAELCAALGKGQLPLYEPDLAELLAAHGSRMQFTAQVAELRRCAVIYFSLDVPTDQDNRSNLAAFEQLMDEMVRHAAPGTVLVLLSQVPPGFTRRWAKVVRASARRDLHLYYQVETLIFGRAVERAVQPERFMVGCSDPTQELPESYGRLLNSFGCPVFRMRYESAELAKISINLCLVSSVCVANTLAEISEAIGAEWSEIVPTLKLDKRIGPHAYLSPGLGIAGGNLERDLATVTNLAEESGADAGVVRAWLAHCQYRRDWALRTIHAQVIRRVPQPTIAVWGLAYKQDTKSTKNSPAVHLIESLRGFPIRAYDPQVVLDRNDLPSFVQVSSALEACRGADVLVVMTPWREFSSVNLASVREWLKGTILIDPFGCLDRQRCTELGFSHHRLGTPSVSKEAVL